MSSLTTSIQNCAGDYSLSNKVNQRNKRCTDWKEEIKLSLFADNVIIYVEDPKESTNM